MSGASRGNWAREHGPKSTKLLVKRQKTMQLVHAVFHLGKVIPKKSMIETPKLKELVKTEITVLKRCNNENVIKLIDSFETDKNVYIIMEFCNGGDMEEYLNKKKVLA